MFQAPGQPQVNDLFVDLRDGRNLLLLTRVLTGKLLVSIGGDVFLISWIFIKFWENYILFFSFLQFIILLDIAKEPSLVYTKWYESFEAKVFFISWTMSSLLIMAEYRIVLPSSTNVRIGDFFSIFLYFLFVKGMRKSCKNFENLILRCEWVFKKWLFNYLGLVQTIF